jgi:hypothetical protein
MEAFVGSPSEQDQVVQRIIYMAKYIGLKTPRAAAEQTMGRALTDEEWEKHKEPFQRNWPLVPDPNSLTERVRRFFKRGIAYE